MRPVSPGYRSRTCAGSGPANTYWSSSPPSTVSSIRSPSSSVRSSALRWVLFSSRPWARPASSITSAKGIATYISSVPGPCPSKRSVHQKWCNRPRLSSGPGRSSRPKWCSPSGIRCCQPAGPADPPSGGRRPDRRPAAPARSAGRGRSPGRRSAPVGRRAGRSAAPPRSRTPALAQPVGGGRRRAGAATTSAAGRRNPAAPAGSGRRPPGRRSRRAPARRSRLSGSPRAAGARAGRPRAAPSADPSPELREDLLLVEPEEALLVLADLVNVHMVVAVVEAALDSLDVLLGVRAADHDLRDRVLRDQGGRLLVVERPGQLLTQFTGECHVRYELVCRAPRLRLVLGPADVVLHVAGLVAAAGVPE